MKRLLSVAASLAFIACGDDGYQEPPAGSYQPTGGMMGSNNPGGNNMMQPGTPMACPDRDRDGFQDAPVVPTRMQSARWRLQRLQQPGQPRPPNCGNLNEDNDCNGQPPARDQACLQACPDRDNDGYADVACTATRERAAIARSDPSVNPGQVERCGNRKDDNCSGFDAPCLMNCTDGDADGFGMGSGCYGLIVTTEIAT